MSKIRPPTSGLWLYQGDDSQQSVIGIVPPRLSFQVFVRCSVVFPTISLSNAIYGMILA